ncbi:MAG: hypothetical protein ABI763_06455 [Bacteroidota bacterium]
MLEIDVSESSSSSVNSRISVLFSTHSEKKLLESLKPEVKLLLFHIDNASLEKIELLKKVMNQFREIKVLIYSPYVVKVEDKLAGINPSRIKTVSMLNGSPEFFEAIKVLLPDHKNHPVEEQRKNVNTSPGFDIIRKKRKWILILKLIADGKKPKEMVEMTGLKYETINSYIEQMVKETGCGNISELLLIAEKKKLL